MHASTSSSRAARTASSRSTDCARRITRVRRSRFFFQAEDGIRDIGVTGVQKCALPIFMAGFEDHEAVVPVRARIHLLRGKLALAAATVERRLGAIGENRLESALLLELLGE